MPQLMVCSECGQSLYEGEVLRSPSEILKKYEGRCPACNKNLSFSSGNVKVTLCEEGGGSRGGASPTRIPPR